jgi:hypothetical protein
MEVRILARIRPPANKSIYFGDSTAISGLVL